MYSHVNTSLEDLAASDDEGIVTLRLSENLKAMHLTDQRVDRFFGKSSGVMLIQKAIDLKKEVTGSEEEFRSHWFRPIDQDSFPVSSHPSRLQMHTDL